MARIILMIIVVLIIVCLLISAFDMNRFVVRRYDVTEQRCSHDFRIVHISDLHDRSYGHLNSKLKKRIDMLHPDIIMMSGDIMTAGRHNGPQKNADDLVISLAREYPVYFSLGNHEDKMKNRSERFGTSYTDAVKLYRSAGVHILDNTSEFEEKSGTIITGLSISKRYYKRLDRKEPSAESVDKLIGRKDDGYMNILLAHNPLYFDSYSSWGADLVLSGHIHGGIVRIPGIGGLLSPDCTFFPKYDGGRFEENGSVMIVSRGLGTHTIPIRVFNPGELVCIDVHRTES